MIRGRTSTVFLGIKHGKSLSCSVYASQKIWNQYMYLRTTQAWKSFCAMITPLNFFNFNHKWHIGKNHDKLCILFINYRYQEGYSTKWKVQLDHSFPICQSGEHWEFCVCWRKAIINSRLIYALKIHYEQFFKYEQLKPQMHKIVRYWWDQPSDTNVNKLSQIEYNKVW